MDSAELRALQQPLKDAYREDPENAVVTLRARGQAHPAEMTISAGDGTGGLIPQA